MKMTLIWLATALSAMAFSIFPAFQNELWAGTSSSVRLSIFATQLLMLGSGIIYGTQWPWR